MEAPFSPSVAPTWARKLMTSYSQSLWLAFPVQSYQDCMRYHLGNHSDNTHLPIYTYHLDFCFLHVFLLFCRIVCITGESSEEKSGHVLVEVSGAGHKGFSSQIFRYQVSQRNNGLNVLCMVIQNVNRMVTPCSVCEQEPLLEGVSPQRGPRAGGTSLTITGKKLLTGRPSDISVLLGNVPCVM